MKKPKLLIVDDSAYICAQIKKIFENENISLEVANNGIEALEKVCSFQPDLILLDVVLPDIEGYDLYQKIKEVDKNYAVIIFLTSRAQESDVVKGFSLGACDYINKPFHNEILKSRIKVHLKEKQQNDDLRKLNEEMEANMRKLNSMAFRDSLTGLFNRRYVSERLKSELLNSRCQIGMMMCDVDDFKHINDYYGHEIGDIVLIGIANILESAADDMSVIRWGGEEFLIFLFGKSKEEIYQISEHIRKSIEAFPFSSEGIRFKCTISIGLALYEPSLHFDDNLKHADEALYTGKRSGKNCSIWYDGIYK